MEQKKLSPGKLLDENGWLNEQGYANSLVKDYARSDIKGQGMRIKEWDYYLVYNNDFGVALTVADNSYMGLVSVTVLDFNKAVYTTKDAMFLFPFGKMNLPPSSRTGDVKYRKKGLAIEFKHVHEERVLKLHMDDFEDGKPLLLEIHLMHEPEDSMVIATPFKEKKTAFYYNQKIIGMQAKGVMEYKGRLLRFLPQSSFGILDWGRGVWTYNNTWYWGAANGMIDGKVFGFNIGYGFGDTSAATENMLFYDGTAHKLLEVNFHIPTTDAGEDDFMEPWEFSSSDGRFEMVFEPILDRCALTKVGPIMSDQHQIFGRFTGDAILTDGTKLRLENFLGFAEKVHNKW